jgi:hypothetical protein
MGKRLDSGSGARSGSENMLKIASVFLKVFQNCGGLGAERDDMRAAALHFFGRDSPLPAVKVNLCPLRL